MNICLGDEFEGSAVYFGRKDTAENCTSDLAASDDLEADGGDRSRSWGDQHERR